MDKPKREAILDLSKYVNERIRVKFTGGREGVCGSLPRPGQRGDAQGDQSRHSDRRAQGFRPALEPRPR